MKRKPVIPRLLANQDVERAIDYYLHEGAPQAALAFVDALQKAYAKLGRQPGVGSPRYAHTLSIPGLRTLSLKALPYVVCYVEADSFVDVWRVLHQQRDIPAHLDK